MKQTTEAQIIKKECPKCGGTGKNLESALSIYGGFSKQFFPCNDCRGTGFIDGVYENVKVFKPIKN